MTQHYPQLRVKVRSLAEEARIIRHEERKLIGCKRRVPEFHTLGGDEPDKAAPGPLKRVGGTIAYLRNRQMDDAATVALCQYESLRKHRLGLRVDARAAKLAYAFLRGKPYTGEHGAEPKGSSLPPFDAILRLVSKYGDKTGGAAAAAVATWLGVVLKVDGSRYHVGWPLTSRRAAS
jgi:hypothetical protein